MQGVRGACTGGGTAWFYLAVEGYVNNVLQNGECLSSWV